DLLFVVAELERVLLILALGLLVLVGQDLAVYLLGALFHRDLHGQHLLAAGLEGGQQTLQLLLADLAEQFFQLLLGLLEFVEGLVLVAGGVVALVVLDLLAGLVLVGDGVADALLGLVGVVGVLVPAALLVVLLLVALLVAGLAGLVA